MPQPRRRGLGSRGVSHLSMFPVAAGLAIPLAFVGRSGAALVSAIVFGVGVTAMFAVERLLPRRSRGRRAVRSWLARLDHAACTG